MRTIIEVRLNKEMLKEILLGLKEIEQKRELTPLEERLKKACSLHVKDEEVRGR